MINFTENEKRFSDLINYGRVQIKKDKDVKSFIDFAYDKGFRLNGLKENGITTLKRM